jgi:hypothetical protein
MLLVTTESSQNIYNWPSEMANCFQSFVKCRIGVRLTSTFIRRHEVLFIEFKPFFSERQFH